MPNNFDAIIAAVERAATRGLQQGADVIHQEAVLRAPKETGVLRNSSYTEAEGNEAIVAFDTPYAVKQHEELGYHHQDGEAKYLENACIAKKEVVAHVIAESIKEGLAGR